MALASDKTSIMTSFAYAQQQLSEIKAIDYFFAKEMYQAFDIPVDDGEVLAHVFIVLSTYLRAGHTCLAIREIADKCWGSASDELGQCIHQGFTFPDTASLTHLLNQLELAYDNNNLLVFHQQNLYMRRYFNFETELEGYIKQRLGQKISYPINKVSACIQTLFPAQLVTNTNENDVDWQKLAVANAINKNFTVIAGGPGTGKTYTVTKLLAALIMLTDDRHGTEGTNTKNQTLDIALVAPTGKAAQRLTESIVNAIAGFSELIDEKVLSAIPSHAQTIHRLLGVIPNSPNFRHHQNNLLSCDVLLIDEVSMVDLPMMTRLFRALKSNTKLILLGDADQLPSVAVGSVLADIAPRPHHGFSQSNYHYLAQVCQLEESQLKAAFNHEADSRCDHLSLLMKSRRFDGEGGIGKLASSVIQGDAVHSWKLLCANKGVMTLKDSQLSLAEGELHAWLLPLVKQYYQGISQCTRIEQAFELLAKFRVLCVTRQGEHGVDAINQWITALLSEHVNFAQERQYFHGMPIMISENDYPLGLFNGDIGLIWRNDSGQLMAFFETTENSYKNLLPSRLPRFDHVYAMTIHKTQGSEFEHVAMVLPKNSNNQLLSRELLYTGITRAKKALTIASSQQPWQQGVTKAVKRNSGLTLS
jgi:exodeoxyribonuclease V alpha subunit